MRLEKQSSIYQNIIIFSVLITLVFSSWINKDSMIIPKLILLIICAFYLLPKIIYVLPTVLKFKYIRYLIIILTLIIFQTIFVLMVSTAPFEQQFFGTTGRGLGVVTIISLLVIMLASAIYIRKDNLNELLFGIVISCSISSLYSLFQSFGVDFLQWESRTNGVIGTLGNPNFQSSFVALSLIPTFVLFSNLKIKYFVSVFLSFFLLLVIVRTQSTQGYVAAVFAVFLFLIILFYYKNKYVSFALITSLIFFGTMAIFGMLNKGPLSQYLYKVSVQSRGDFWRSAFATANDHPFFGVGIDSFGDYYLKYRDEIAISHPFAEYTNNSHNFFLEYAATAGYPMLILQVSIIVLTIISFLRIQRFSSTFDMKISAIFVAWVVFQLQSFISPGNLPMMTWNAILTGSLIGVSILVTNETNELVPNNWKVLNKTRLVSYILVSIAILIAYPFFNTDRQQLQAMNTGNGDLAIASAKQYPESVFRYQTISRELLNSNLPIQALDVARSAVQFNPQSANLWALIAINPAASIEERLAAKAKILKLDPLNKEVINYEIK